MNATSAGQPRRPRRAAPAAVIVALCALAALAGPASAQYRQAKVDPRAAQPAPTILENVGIDQKLNAQVPADLVFKDEAGKDVRLGDYFGRRPLVLCLVYYECPMLCTIVLNETLKTLKLVKDLDIGTGYDVLTVSFDPKETPALAAAKKSVYLSQYKRDGADKGWHFLTGSEASIKALTETVGFRYTWDEQHKQYVHSSGLMILTPDGRVSRYFYGVDYAPQDVKLSLVEASGNKIGSPVDRVMLYCFQYNPHTGKYTLVVTRLIHVAGVVTVVGLAAFMFVSLRRERARAKVVADDVPRHGFEVTNDPRSDESNGGADEGARRG